MRLRAAELGAVFYYVGTDVLELTPALTISDPEIDEGVEPRSRRWPTSPAGRVSDAAVSWHW